MKFINSTGISVRIRLIDKDKRYIWKSIDPNETIDLPEQYGFALGFEPLKEHKKISKQKNKSEPEKHKLTIEELTKIKGIGKKTAKDIITAYPYKEDLVEAIKQDKELPFRDDVVEKLIKRYG